MYTDDPETIGEAVGGLSVRETDAEEGAADADGVAHGAADDADGSGGACGSLVAMRDNADMILAAAEYEYAHDKYRRCHRLSSAVLAKDPFQHAVLPVHICSMTKLQVASPSSPLRAITPTDHAVDTRHAPYASLDRAAASFGPLRTRALARRGVPAVRRLVVRRRLLLPHGQRFRIGACHVDIPIATSTPAAMTPTTRASICAGASVLLQGDDAQPSLRAGMGRVRPRVRRAGRVRPGA